MCGYPFNHIYGMTQKFRGTNGAYALAMLEN
jgi:hypothetical protein